MFQNEFYWYLIWLEKHTRENANGFYVEVFQNNKGQYSSTTGMRWGHAEQYLRSNILTTCRGEGCGFWVLWPLCCWEKQMQRSEGVWSTQHLKDQGKVQTRPATLEYGLSFCHKLYGCPNCPHWPPLTKVLDKKEGYYSLSSNHFV